MKRALIIGIDDYPNSPLGGCVNDASAVANTLRTNGDGSPNFSTKLITSNGEAVNAALMHEELTQLFASDADTVLFYFAGHGILVPETGAGYLVSQDGRKPNWGISLGDVLTLANGAYPRIKSTVIILDSCHSGFAGEIPNIGNQVISAIATGVTLLTGCDRNETASDDGGDGHGLFTSLLLDALSGSACDICGNITPASVYAHIDQSLGAWDQRPIYKANVQQFVRLRQVSPKVPVDVLRRLPTYFPDPSTVFKLDPSFEPDRENVPDEFKNLPIDDDNVKTFKELQTCNRHGLVIPVDAEHMYYAAINSKGCRLTALGAHYRRLAIDERI
jgi:Caspase domain